eukprot:15004736-Alexandrium_andersonii.AAC.1
MQKIKHLASNSMAGNAPALVHKKAWRSTGGDCRHPCHLVVSSTGSERKQKERLRMACMVGAHWYT